jgi:predicted small integral membrane protein
MAISALFLGALLIFYITLILLVVWFWTLKLRLLSGLIAAISLLVTLLVVFLFVRAANNPTDINGNPIPSVRTP